MEILKLKLDENLYHALLKDVTSGGRPVGNSGRQGARLEMI